MNRVSSALLRFPAFLKLFFSFFLSLTNAVLDKLFRLSFPFFPFPMTTAAKAHVLKSDRLLIVCHTTNHITTYHTVYRVRIPWVRAVCALTQIFKNSNRHITMDYATSWNSNSLKLRR